MRFGFIAHPGFKSPSLRSALSPVPGRGFVLWQALAFGVARALTARDRFGRPPAHPLDSALGSIAPVAQRIEHLTTDQEVRGSNPFGRTRVTSFNLHPVEWRRFVHFGLARVCAGCRQRSSCGAHLNGLPPLRSGTRLLRWATKLPPVAGHGPRLAALRAQAVS